MDSRCVFLADAAATQGLGRALAHDWLSRRHQPPPILLLEGDLGAGKTCLTQGLAEGLGIDEAITSPSFALAQHYRGQGPNGAATALVHLDLYRLEHPAAADELFAQEEEEAQALGALMAVEWPGRLSFVPEGAWRVRLQLAEGGDPEAGRLAWIEALP
jgi:tRNA threonylcarbamoyladenosine biosynthesis protein TsaE